jgi:phosphoribosyl-dephospho-CoA transferase
MKTATKNRQTSIAPINTEMTTSRVTSITMEIPKPIKDTPAVRQAWVRLYEAITGKRRVSRQNTLAHQN